MTSRLWNAIVLSVGMLVAFILGVFAADDLGRLL